MSSSRNKPTFADGSWMDVDGNGNLVFYSKAGATLVSINNQGTIIGGTNSKFKNDSNGLPVTSNGITLAGQGFPLIVAAPSPSLNQVAAKTNFINYTPPAAIGTYRLSFMVNITVATTYSITATGTWDDSEGNELSQIIGGFDSSGTVLVGGLISSVLGPGAGVYYGSALFTIDNSGDAITLSTVGTFTTVTYDLAAILERLQ